MQREPHGMIATNAVTRAPTNLKCSTKDPDLAGL